MVASVRPPRQARDRQAQDLPTGTVVEGYVCDAGVYPPRRDGLNRRIKKHIDTQAPASPDGVDTYRHFYYKNAWQILETRSTTSDENTQPETLKPEFQYVWSLRYIDSPVLRDENKDGDDDCIDGSDERLYYLNDANMNVTALIEPDGDVAERYTYDPYGKVTIYNLDWSATVDWADSKKNEVLYCGYRRDPETGLYHVRNRVYHPTLGRWLQRDPSGYQDGLSLYEYGRSEPLGTRDPKGLIVGADQIISPGAAVRRTARGESAGHWLKRGSAALAAGQRPLLGLKTLRSQNLYPFGYLGYKTYLVGINNAFVYTCEYAWLDLGHFFQSAFWAYATGSPTAALTAGMLIEMGQELHRKTGLPPEVWGESAWTAEDIPSNLVGSYFGKDIYDKDKALKNKQPWWRLIPPSTNIANAFKQRLKEWGAVSHDKPVVLPILKADAKSWTGPSGKVLPAARQKTLGGALSFQRRGIAYKCLCDGDEPKRQFRWEP